MDNVCNRCLFSIPSKVEMAEEQEYLRCKDKLYTNIPEPVSMFEANAKLPKTMDLVSTLLHFPRTNFIQLHCSYQKGKATACCCLHWKYYMP